MYWERLTKGFSEARQAREEGKDELVRLLEHYYEILCDMLGEEGSIILDQYTACLDLLNKQDFGDMAVFIESQRKTR